MFVVSIKDYHKDLIQHIRDRTPLCDMIPFETVMKRFVQAIMDISINEKSVHYLNSTDIELDTLYTKFEVHLLKECSSFVKNALEIGFKTKNLKIVYKTFNEYSTTIKSILPARSQKEFEKAKTNIVIKFIRFILTTRMKSFEKFDYSKIEKSWSPAQEDSMKAQFSSQNSVFLKHFFKVVGEKYDQEKFQRYWFMTLGKDTSLLIKFYDDSLLIFDRLLKAYSARDTKIRNYKQKAGIMLPKDAEEMANLSLVKPYNNLFGKLVIRQFSEAK